MTEITSRLSTALADRYRIERELGSGGMATVYLAEDLKLHRKVAVKVLRPDLAATLGPERFLREIEVAAQLHHPHILPLHDSGEADGFLYYVMPYEEGESLREKLEKDGELPVMEAVRLLRDVVDALAHAHEHGVVHRDIKPDNVMLSGRHALVTDFGVAKAVSEATGRQQLTTAGVALGTPAYMAPEQAVADPHIDHRADIYAVGVLAYELLSGSPPFTGATPQAVLTAHVTKAPEPITDHRAAVPPALAAVVMRCLEKKPADRWQSAEELLSQLEVLATPSGGITPTATAPVSAVPQRSSWRRPALYVTAGVAALALGLATVRRGAEAPIGDVDPRPTLVVLPFQDIGEAEDEFFANGISEEITSRLSRVRGLRVIARNSALRFDASETSAQEFGRTLDADYVLDGTVRWVRGGTGGVRVRVTPALIQVSDAQQVWSEGYDAVVTDVLGIQSDVSSKVADALRVELGADERSRLVDAGTSNPEAQSEYLVGRFKWRKRTPEGLTQAADHFQRAVDVDPDYARAWAGLADAVGLFPYYGVERYPKREAYDRAERAVRRGLALDSTLAEGWASLCQVLQNGSWDWEGAEQACRRAVALDPDYATAHQWLGEVYFATGRIDEALSAAARAVELDPLSPMIQNILGYFLSGAGRLAEAEATLRRSAELEPGLGSPVGNLSVLLMNQGRADEAIAVFGTLPANDGVEQSLIEFEAVIIRGIADTGARAGAIAAIDQAGPDYEASTPLGQRVWHYIGLGLFDRAFAVVDTLLTLRDEAMIFAHGDMRFKLLRRDPRWQTVSRRMGID